MLMKVHTTAGLVEKGFWHESGSLALAERAEPGDVFDQHARVTGPDQAQHGCLQFTLTCTAALVVVILNGHSHSDQMGGDRGAKVLKPVQRRNGVVTAVVCRGLPV